MLGCAVQLQQPRLWPGWAYAAMALACVVLSLARVRARVLVPGWVLRVALALLLFGVLGFASTGLRALARADRALPPAWEGRDLMLVGRIDSLPQRDAVGQRFEFAVESAAEPGVGGAVEETSRSGTPDEVQPLPFAADLRRVQLAWYGAAGAGAGAEGGVAGRTVPVLMAGDRWRILVRLKAPHGLANPWGSDAELAAWDKGVQAWGHVRQGPRDPLPVLLGPASALALGAGLDRLRQRLRDALLEQVADRGAAGVLAALVVGDQAAVLPADWDLFRSTGIAHLVSISGLHVTVFAWAAALAVGALWRRSGRLCEAWPAPHAAVAGGLLLAAAYAAFSGGGVPAQRTVGMLALVGLLRLSGRRWPWPATWLGVAALVSAWDPWALLQPGFWLSFVAVGVLIAGGSEHKGKARHAQDAQDAEDAADVAGAADVGAWAAQEEAADAAEVARGTRDRLPRSGKPGVWRARGLSLLREQGLVTLALAPLTLLLFGQLSLVGLLANLLAIPWMTCVVLPLALAGVAWPALWQPAAWALQAQGTVLQWLAGWPGAALVLPAAPGWMAAAAIAGGLLAALRLAPRLRLAGLPLMLPLLLWQPPRPAPGGFELLAIDVGQGQAVLVRSAGHDLLYDAGPRWSEEQDAGQRVLVPGLRALGAHLDVLVVSHPDSDHAGGAAAVLADQPEAELLASLPDGHALASMRPPHPCLAGRRWTWDGVRFEFLHPREEDLRGDLAMRHPNAHSCVLRIEAQDGASALLAGDLEAPQELRLVREAQASQASRVWHDGRGEGGEASGPALRADFLLVPHHGSRTSSTEAWLDAVRPRVALVQAGYRNRYGHPAPQVMARYTARAIPVTATPACGAARWASSSPGRIDCHRDDDRHYWQHRLPAGGPDIAILSHEEPQR